MPTSEASPRPAFHRWLQDNLLTYSAAAGMLDCSRETLRRYCLPFSDPRRRFPKQALLRRIAHLTDGEITGHSFVEPAGVPRGANAGKVFA